MEAHAIAYSPDERRVALGGPRGRVEVYAVRERDGAPEALLGAVERSGAEVVQLAFTPGGALVSLCADGSFALHDAWGGRVVRAGKVGGEKVGGARAGGEAVQGGLAPSGSFLFLSCASGGRLQALRVALATGEVREGPTLPASAAGAPVWGLDDACAAYHFRAKGEEGLLFVDFERGEVKRRLFSHPALREEAGGAPVLDLSPELGLGVRRDYAPLEALAAGGRTWLLLKLQVFALPSLAPLRSLATEAFRVEDGGVDVRAVWVLPEGCEEYLTARNRLLERIRGVRLAPARRSAWVALGGDRVREVGLDGAWRSPLIRCGAHLPSKGEPGASRAGARSTPLVVSPSGQRVALGGGGVFLDRRCLDPGAGGTWRAPRAERGPVVEAPDFIGLTGGGHLVLARGDEVFVVGADDGELHSRFALEPGSGEVTGASLSPDGAYLALSMSGSEPLLLGLESGSVTGLGGPAHTLGVRFLPDGQLLLVHAQGALVLLDLASGRRVVHRAGDEGPAGEPLSLREEVHGFTSWEQGGVTHAAVCDARDVVQTYVLAEGQVRTGKVFPVEGNARRVACARDTLAVAGRGGLLLLDVRGGQCRHHLPVEHPLLLERGECTDTLLVFDAEVGTLFRVQEEGALQELLSVPGRTLQVAVSEAAGRAAVLGDDGAVQLRDLDSALTVVVLELCVEATGGRVLRQRRTGAVVSLPGRRAGAAGAGGASPQR